LIPIPIGLIVSLFLYLISSLANGDSRRAVNRFNEGNDCFDRGSFEQAIAMYDEAIEHKPDFPEAYYNRGLAYAAGEDYGQAIADWSQAIKLDPGLVRAYYSRGLAYYVQGNIKGAIADFDEVIGRTPESIADLWRDVEPDSDNRVLDHLATNSFTIDLPRVHAYRGLAYLATGQVRLALVDLDKAIELRPSLALAYYGHGVACLEIGDYEQAITDLVTVLELDSDSAVRRDAEALLQELGIESERWPSS
jgi:tetratricopeptide (TPR) repeat protein